jgi:MOSC domain-containing protein YiiM
LQLHGIVTSINVSAGGVPKKPIPWARICADGVDGDRQNDFVFHGGPDRAVCLYSLELIDALQGEGHSIRPGSIGENLTVSGIEWQEVRPGARVEVGEVLLEITKGASPCQKIAGSFSDANFTRVSQKVHPGWSRFYARVLREGVVSVDDRVVVTPPVSLF